MKQRIIIRLDPATRAKLDELSTKSGMSVAALIRACIDYALPRIRFTQKDQA